MPIEPWNTGTDGADGCEDMPRKSVCIRLTDDPVRQKRGSCALFLPSGEDGFGQSPKLKSFSSPRELFAINICNFQGSIWACFFNSIFHRLLDTTPTSFFSSFNSPVFDMDAIMS